MPVCEFCGKVRPCVIVWFNGEGKIRPVTICVDHLREDLTTWYKYGRATKQKIKEGHNELAKGEELTYFEFE